jgi:hypothetical protein
MMKRTRLLAAALLAALAGATAPVSAAKKAAKPAAEQVDRQAVLDAIARMDKAMGERNAAAYLAQIDPAAEIHLNTPTSQGAQQMKFSYEEYRQMVASSFADAIFYQVRRQDVTVTPMLEGKALVTDLLFEHIAMKGKESKTITSERMLFARRDGVYKLIAFGGNVVSSSK